MITVDRKQFIDAVKLASLAFKKDDIAILQAVKLTANGKLTIEGTNLDFFARAEIPCEGSECEMLIDDPRAVVSAVEACDSETIELGKQDGRVTFKAGQLDASLCALSPEGFPAGKPLAKEIFGCTISAGELEQMRRVMPAGCPVEKRRYYLKGVNVKKVGDRTYRFAATDGHRLMIVDIPLPDAAGELPDNFTIPRRFLAAALASFAKSGEAISFRVAPVENSKFLRVCFSGKIGGSHFDLVGKQLGGFYPGYNRAIPHDPPYLMRCRRSDLLRALQTLIPLSTSSFRVMGLVFSHGLVRVETKLSSLGDGMVDIAAEHNLPEGFVICFNGKYLRDSLSALHGEEVEFGLGAGAEAPTAITDPADTALKTVLMPVRV